MTATTVTIPGIGSVPLHATELDLSNRHLDALPEEVFLLVSLRVLNVSGNSLAAVPDAVQCLQQLHTLNLAGNRLRTLPSTLGACQGLVHLNLAGNGLDHLPAVALELRGLEQLYLGGNNLASLPDGIGALDQLRVLYLGGNQLTRVPDGLAHLARLECLNLADNGLAALPAGGFDHLQALVILSLQNNQLTELPAALAHMSSLEEINIQGNPLQLPPCSRTQRGSRVVQPPTLLELAARSIIAASTAAEDSNTLPDELVDYLLTARPCEISGCSGVCLGDKEASVVFVDICGELQLPVRMHICSSHGTAAPAITKVASCTQPVDAKHSTAAATTGGEQAALVG